MSSVVYIILIKCSPCSTDQIVECRAQFGTLWVDSNPLSCTRKPMIPVGFMFINCRQGSQDEILQKVEIIPEVKYAYKLDKSYDIVVKIESDSEERFTSAISKIRATAGILNTDTIIGFKKS